VIGSHTFTFTYIHIHSHTFDTHTHTLAPLTMILQMIACLRRSDSDSIDHSHFSSASNGPLSLTSSASSAGSAGNAGSASSASACASADNADNTPTVCTAENAARTCTTFPTTATATAATPLSIRKYEDLLARDYNTDDLDNLHYLVPFCSLDLHLDPTETSEDDDDDALCEEEEESLELQQLMQQQPNNNNKHNHNHNNNHNNNHNHNDACYFDTSTRQLLDEDLWWGGKVVTAAADTDHGEHWNNNNNKTHSIIPSVASMESLQDHLATDQQDFWDKEDCQGCAADIRSYSSTLRLDVPNEIFVSLRDNDMSHQQQQQQQQQQQNQQQESWIFDPVEPLIQGQLPLNATDALQHAANDMEALLKSYLARHDNGCQDSADDEALISEACHLLELYPEAAQIRYAPITTTLSKGSKSHKKKKNESKRLVSTETSISSVVVRNGTGSSHPQDHVSGSPSSYCRILAGTACYPLAFFAATGNQRGVRAAYQAFPESVSHSVGLGTPLHYACYHGVNASVVAFLLEKYPDAARMSNEQYQTPLHLACAASSSSHVKTTTLNQNVVQLLLARYPAAAQLADGNGYTPLHLACQNQPSVHILSALTNACPGVIYASTRTMEKPLHVAVRHQASPAVLKFLLEQDPYQASATDVDFRSPLHLVAMTPTVS
jgi:hypothetical protein